MNIPEIHRHLKTRWLGKKIHFRESADSTNSWATSTQHGTKRRGEVFLADFQTRGHGRHGRVWESPAGKNILMSFIDIPPANREKTFQLTLVAGVALHVALKELFSKLEFKLKWPNDLLLNGKKIAGILAEVHDEEVVMGVGINVNAPSSDLSPQLTDRCISLCDVLKRDLPREKILSLFLSSYETWRDIFDRDGIAPVIKAWNEHTFLTDKQIRVEEEKESYEGVAESLDEDGFLVVATPQGKKTVMAGDVTCF